MISRFCMFRDLLKKLKISAYFLCYSRKERQPKFICVIIKLRRMRTVSKLFCLLWLQHENGGMDVLTAQRIEAGQRLQRSSTTGESLCVFIPLFARARTMNDVPTIAIPVACSRHHFLPIVTL